MLVAHELGPLAPLIDRAVVLRDGRVVYDGAPPRARRARPATAHAHHHVHPHAGATTAGAASELEGGR